MSTSAGVVVGGAAPNHTIEIPADSSKEKVKALLKACDDGEHGVLATEVKVAVLSSKRPLQEYVRILRWLAFLRQPMRIMTSPTCAWMHVRKQQNKLEN